MYSVEYCSYDNDCCIYIYHSAIVFYDRPPRRFRPADLEEKHKVSVFSSHSTHNKNSYVILALQVVKKH